jgi:hypothetical protein
MLISTKNGNIDTNTEVINNLLPSKAEFKHILGLNTIPSIKTVQIEVAIKFLVKLTSLLLIRLNIKKAIRNKISDKQKIIIIYIPSKLLISFQKFNTKS